ncbi:Aldedh-domain-containing protein [Coniophora puteana RWD-64-598 SS2]|uniref:Aldedh-domain-containing protein n=1 Tax=Coniophora puteana (strain RWD-64-598) TaxID=741705 RepID=A0A5M3N3I4_CONPW|nr:Aldedh-domain-containing protein [Coniophora puteana RWD-64-598 SS2]EIW85451.1 Aldedh-domain-containing protein [Coniophora puteana RWD-64-598 SS2]
MPFYSAIFHPLRTLNLWLENDANASVFDVVFLFSVFSAFGIWLVFDRYQRKHNNPVPFTWDAPDPADPMWKSVVIKNANLKSHLEYPDLMPLQHPDRDYITSYDPASNLHIGTFHADTRADIEDKILKARAAQETWRLSTFQERRRVMRSLLKWLVDNQDVCARVACRDTGKTLVDAALGEVITTCSKLEWMINHGEEALKTETRHSNLMLCYKTSEVIYEPKGVATAIVSWNYPLHNAWSPIIAALFSGNSVVIKCSEHVQWSTSWFVGAVQQCLFTCGFPEDAVQLVCCWPDQVEALTRSPLIKHITFIGSEEVGRKVAVAATEHLTPVTLELGGKDPAIILPGTDLKRWISIWMRGVFQNAGQNCIGIERLIVHSSQYDALYEMFCERVAKLRLGSVLAPTAEGYINTVDMGCMVTAARFQNFQDFIFEAQNEGAQIDIGGKPADHVVTESNTYFQPTVVGDVDPKMELAQKEMFAPIATIIRYDDISEAVEIANGTRYGLGASVFGPHQDTCLEVARELDCGMVSINDFGVFYVNQDLPFGGNKASGYGRFGGPEGLRALTNPKSVMYDRWPSLIQTGIPKVLDYPIRSLIKSRDFVEGLIVLLYGDTYRTRFNGLLQLSNAARR